MQARQWSCVSCTVTRAFWVRGAVASICAAVLALYGQSAASAADFPTRPLRLIVGQAPGSGTDLVARAIVPMWSELLGQSIVVDNRPGVGEIRAATVAARSAPDGYTQLFGSISSHGIAPAVYTHIDYDPAADFAPISLVATTPNVLATAPGSVLRSVSDLIGEARAKPGALGYASTAGSSTHLGMELLKRRLGLDLLHVPYAAGPAASIDVLTGRVALGLFNLPLQIDTIRAGRMRALAVTSLKRSPQLPDVPTLDEAGVPGYELVVWYAVFVPGGTPPAIKSRLYSTLAKAGSDSGFIERLTKMATQVVISTPEQLARFSHAEIEKWRRVARDAGIKLHN